MKILFVEDAPHWVSEFLPQLEQLGEVIHVKSFKGAQQVISKELESLGLVVCDHNILFWEDDALKPGKGSNVYKELRRKEKRKDLNPLNFIHFSADPCPESYSTNDDKLYSYHKKTGFKLLNTIKEKVL